MKIAHLSDIHFFNAPFKLSNLFSKRLLGILNDRFNPHRKALKYDPFELPLVLKELEVQWVFISGDFTTTSTKEEYEIASSFIKALKDQGLKVLCIPGNHDHYTLSAHKARRFYQYMDAPKELKKNRFAFVPLDSSTSCLLLDTTYATPFWSSQGLFTKELEKELTDFLDKRPPHQRFFVMNHFPIYPNDRPKRHQMKRKQALLDLLMNTPNIVAYLHGHTHRSELSLSQTPLSINCGSLTLTQHGSFHVMNLESEFLEVEQYQLFNEKWQAMWKKTFPMLNHHEGY